MEEKKKQPKGVPINDEKLMGMNRRRFVRMQQGAKCITWVFALSVIWQEMLMPLIVSRKSFWLIWISWIIIWKNSVKIMINLRG